MATGYFRSSLAAAPGSSSRSGSSSATLGSAAAESLCNCLELCIEIEPQVDANAILTSLIEWWLDELAQQSAA
jgi:hypothetical protein